MEVNMTARVMLSRVGGSFRSVSGWRREDPPVASTANPQSPASFAVALTVADLDEVQARFDRRLPGSVWCGFASWEETHDSRRPRPDDCRNPCGPVRPDATRLVLFTSTDGRRHLTLSRFSDGHLELSGETGRIVASGFEIADLLAVVEHPGRA
jgi:hypothetical protein